MNYEFDEVPDRRGTGSLKWQKYVGRDILPMWVADMDFRSSPEVVEGLRQRLEHGVYGYTLPPEGVVEAVQEYLRRSYRWSVGSEEILWLPGLVPALNLACRAYTGEDGEVTTFAPVYPPFLSAPQNASRGVIKVPLVEKENRWVMDLCRLEESLKASGKCRLLLLCNPHNPGGTVFTKGELLELGEICERYDLVICSDEIHCDLILDEGEKHVPIATLSPELSARTLTLMAPSKTYNLPGLACAFAVIPNAELRRTFERTARGIITEVNLFGYAGCEAAYRHGEPWRQQLIAYLRANRDLVYRTVSEEMPGIRMLPMAATYLAWLDIRELGWEDPLGTFEKAGVGLSDGRPFGDGNFLRLNFGCPRSRLEEGLGRMRAALA